MTSGRKIQVCTWTLLVMVALIKAIISVACKPVKRASRYVSRVLHSKSFPYCCLCTLESKPGQAGHGALGSGKLHPHPGHFQIFIGMEEVQSNTLHVCQRKLHRSGQPFYPIAFASRCWLLNASTNQQLVRLILPRLPSLAQCVMPGDDEDEDDDDDDDDDDNAAPGPLSKTIASLVLGQCPNQRRIWVVLMLVFDIADPISRALKDQWTKRKPNRCPNQACPTLNIMRPMVLPESCLAQSEAQTLSIQDSLIRVSLTCNVVVFACLHLSCFFAGSRKPTPPTSKPPSVAS